MGCIQSSSESCVVFCAAISLVSCLPNDTRPIPGSLEVTVTADPLVLGGTPSVSTVDGWTVTYDRFMISISASLDGDTTCSSYYNDGYRRILDMGVPGPQKVNLLYALGHCDFGFRVASTTPDPYLPLGRGVTMADENLMGAAGADPYTTDRNGKPQPTGVALYARGRATKDGDTKTFTWEFRRRISYQNCAAPLNTGDAGPAGDTGAVESIGDSGESGSIRDAGDDGNAADAGPRGPQGVDLASREAKTVDIRIHGESLFLDSTNAAEGRLRFDFLAAADDKYGNGDGDIALSELGLVPLTDIGLARRYVQAPGDLTAAAPAMSAWTTLEDFVYLGLFPKVSRFENGGTCDTNLRGR